MISTPPIIVYTDGSCYALTRQGGWAYFIESGLGEEKAGVGRMFDTTISRMEVRAVIEVLQFLLPEHKDREVIIYSDSQYVVNSVNNVWVFDWEKVGFYNKKNVDLWKRLLTLYRSFTIPPKFIHIRGHQGVEGNEIVDGLADYRDTEGFEILKDEIE